MVSAWGQEGFFNQSGGSHEVADNLEIGLNRGSVGKYNMTNGTLTAHDLHIGENGTGMFFQDSGSVNIEGELFLGRNINNGARAHGYYQLLFGKLDVGLVERIGVEGDAQFDQGGGTNITQELIIADQSGSTGKYMMTNGTLEAAPFDGGSIIVGKGGVGEFYLSDGDISTDNMDVGVTGNGTFSQSNGTNTVYNNLVLSRETGSVGTYDLSSGTLTTGETHVSAFGTAGLFFQTGGLHTTDTLVLGYNAGGSGEYRLHNGGNLNAGTERIGLEGSGIFLNFEGTNTVSGDLILGQGVGSSGSYTLTDDGVLEVKGDEYIGQAGNGTFNQTSGTHTTGGLFLGDNSGSYGSYSLHGGDLIVGDFEVIGGLGAGDFSQDGGTHSTSGDVSIGMNGTYWMTGGDFQAGNNIVNDHLFHMEIADGAGTLTALTFINNGILEGTGTITANVQNFGLISAGNSPGVMNIEGNLTLGDSSTLFFELGGTTQGTEYDYLYVSGMAALGGSLEVELYDLGLGGGTFDPAIGAFFQILYAEDGITGQFLSDYILPDLADGKKWSIAYNDYDVTLHVNAVPVPPAVFLLASGLASLFMVKRRKV